MLCTAEMRYEHARLCIHVAINFKIKNTGASSIVCFTICITSIAG
jgi:hypothetical protein